jgi:hypothetical protein
MHYASLIRINSTIQEFSSEYTVVELVVQANFFILLALESVSFLSSTLSSSQTAQEAGSKNMNETDVCEDENTGISLFATIQLVVFYAPLLIFAIVGIFKIVIYIR